MHSLPIFLRLRERPVVLVGTGPAADAKRRVLERAGARIVDEEDRSAALAIVVDDDGAAARLRVRGVLVNATDRPELCDFTLPAILERAPVLVAVGTGGASAGLAKALRQRVEALLPAELGGLAEALSGARGRLRERWPAAADRRRAIDAALAPGGPLDPLLDGSADAIEAWLAAPDRPAEQGLVTIRLRSPDPDDLTLREARLLGGADRIYTPNRVPSTILARARVDVEIIQSAPPGELPTGLSLLLIS